MTPLALCEEDIGSLATIFPSLLVLMPIVLGGSLLPPSFRNRLGYLFTTLSGFMLRSFHAMQIGAV